MDEKAMNNQQENGLQPILIVNDPSAEHVWKFKWKSVSLQMMAAFIAQSIQVYAGVNLVFSAILLPQLADTGDIILSDSEASWIASLVALSNPIGTILSGPWGDKFGRKIVGLCACVLYLFSLQLILMANNFLLMCVGRVLAGFSGGLTTAALVYVSEISIPELRSTLLSLVSVYVAFGIFLSSLLSLWFDWRMISRIMQLLLVANFLVFLIIPESPVWYATFKGNHVKMEQSLRWFCNNDRDLFERERSKIIMKRRASDLTGKNEEKNRYTQPQVYKPFLLLFVMFFLQQLTGSYVLIFYAVDIFKQIGGRIGDQSEYFSLMLLGLLRLLMAIVTAVTSKYLGRRTILIPTALGMAVTIFLTTLDIDDSVEGKQLEGSTFSLVFALLFISFSAVGMMVIPWTLLGELLPINVRGKLTGLIFAIAYFFMFVMVKLWPYMLRFMGIKNTFTMFSIASLTFALFVYFYLPETRQKRIDEVEKYFLKSNNSNKSNAR